MTKTEAVLDALRSANWAALPQAASHEILAGATAYLHAYARFILENHGPMEHALTPFASPLNVLRVQEVRVNEHAVEECRKLCGRSPCVYDQVFALRALEWAALCEAEHPATIGRESMFDPLLALVINRVPASIRKGDWVVDTSMFPLADWVNRYGAENDDDTGR